MSISQYEQERADEIRRLVNVASTAYLNGKANTSIYVSYLEHYGNLIPSCFEAFNLDQLTTIDEVRFVADGAGHVEFIFNHEVVITEELKDYRIVPTSAGYLKIIAPIQWVDRY